MLISKESSLRVWLGVWVYVICATYVCGVTLGIGYVYMLGMHVFGEVCWRICSVCSCVFGVGMCVGIGFVCVFRCGVGCWMYMCVCWV